MILLTDDRYDNALGAIYSYFSSGTSYFGLVTIEHLWGVRNVFAHELGHTFSLNHNRMSNGGDVDYDEEDWCNFGWRFLDQNNIEQRTIMATIPDTDVEEGESQILNFSNPEIEFHGTPTGNEINANAYLLSRNLCTIGANFEDDELEIVIDGPDLICEEWATYTADILTEPPSGQPGSGPYSYYWAMDDDEIFSDQNGDDPVVYFGNTSSINLYSPVNQTFWLYLQVYGNGVSTNDVLKVESPCGGIPGSGGKASSAKPARLSSAQPFSLSPNPTQDYVRIQFDLPISGSSHYAITNTMGQILSKGVLDCGNMGVFDIGLPNNVFPSGLYYFSLQNGEFFDVQTFSINH